MKRLVLVLAFGAAVGALAACDDRPPQPVEPAPPVIEAPQPPPVETPPVDPYAAQPAPTYPTSDTLPPEQRESAETVKPESETLFY